MWYIVKPIALLTFGSASTKKLTLHHSHLSLNRTSQEGVLALVHVNSSCTFYCCHFSEFAPKDSVSFISCVRETGELDLSWELGSNQGPDVHVYRRVLAQSEQERENELCKILNVLYAV